MKGDHPSDPRGLIKEAYRIESITPGECRSIFLDWALNLPGGSEMRAAVTDLIALYAEHGPDHPMTVVLQAALEDAPAPKRRGGRAGRVGG